MYPKNYIPITEPQKKFLGRLWHWEFWWWTDETKKVQEMIKEGNMSKYDASELISFSKDYDDQKTWLDAHKTDGTINVDKAENHLNQLKQIIAQRSKEVVNKYKTMNS